ncbi:calcium-binding EGF-like domain-containing protein [Myxococcota bacterium]|nr:calcium-binding EGF-like domain-containing protein [Myxococcota bacterium]MBU1534503.1 calcium-binding EGF-like domain-containing protein [Myxococcota bacterium]
MRTKLLLFTGILCILSSLVLVGCDDDDDNNQGACDAVDCGNGTCVDTAGQASCDCDTGYHADGLTCVEDTTSNTAPVFTSTAPTDATELIVTSYDFTCTDADGDDLDFAVDTTDTCDGTLVSNDDGTGNYSFMIADAATTSSCVLAITCTDGTEIVTQTQTITIHAATASECVDDGTWLGQIDGSTDDGTSLNGGTVATTPWDSAYDADLDALVAVMPAAGSSLAVNTPITEATIIAAYYANGLYRMYIADANTEFKVFLTDDASQIPPFVPKTGSRISFTVTEITNYDSTYEITEVDGTTWTLDGTGFDVPVTEISDATPLTAAHVNKVVRVSGTLVSAGSATCGTGYLCYDLDYGAASTVVFRTGAFNVFPVGTCLTFQGPVTLFSGAPQLTTYGNLWFYTW